MSFNKVETKAIQSEGMVSAKPKCPHPCKFKTARSLLERLAGYDEREQILLVELDKLDSAPSVEKIPEIDIDSALTTLKNIILNTRNAKKLRILLQSFIQKIDVNPTDVVIHYHPERVIHDSTGVHSTKGWHAHGDSNPGCRRERAVS